MALSFGAPAFGSTTAGATRACFKTGGGNAAPSAPVALRASGAAIAQVYRWSRAAALAPQVQSIALPAPTPVPPTAPHGSRTHPAQAAEAESRAVTRPGP